MSWVKNTLTSSIGQKVVMSLTGLFLITFLIVHLIGNISLLYTDGDAFNTYAHFMKYNPLIKIGEIVMGVVFLLHIVQGILLMKKNASARTQGYAVAHKHEKVSFTSKYMGQFGLVILAFLILHLWDFFSFKYWRKSDIPMEIIDGVKVENLFAKVIQVYTESPIHWIIYPAAMFVLALHLNHGLQSAFQTLGWNHKKYTPAIKAVGAAYSFIIPLALALIPILIKFGITIGSQH
jgi:succinate dehydrogenase / fumarate reductase, cytochrome b subunit